VSETLGRGEATLGELSEDDQIETRQAQNHFFLIVLRWSSEDQRPRNFPKRVSGWVLTSPADRSNGTQKNPYFVEPFSAARPSRQ
jgi:hypothetical protein